MTEAAPGVRRLVVPPGRPVRVDRLAADLTGLSRSHVQKLISAGRLTASGEPLRANSIVEPGQKALECTKGPSVALRLDLCKQLLAVLDAF